MMLTLQDSLFSASLAVYMTASVFVAAVRSVIHAMWLAEPFAFQTDKEIEKRATF